MTVAPPSDTRECRDRLDREEMVDGVDTARSRSGTASRASDGDILGEGELGLWTGEATLLAAGLIIMSAMATSGSAGVSRPMSLTLLMGQILLFNAGLT